MDANNPAENYEQCSVPALFGPWAACLLGATQPQPGERVLDVGCGTGIVARRAAPLVGSQGGVAGLDLNPAMLAVARAAGEREGVAVDWREGRAEALPFAGGEFDLVLSQFAVMFFADRPAAFHEMYRVLAPGGRLALSTFQSIDRHPFYRALDEAIQRRLAMSSVGEIFALDDAGALRALLTDAGFRDIEIEPVSMTARFPDPDGFIAGEIELDTAAIPSMQHLDERARGEMVALIHEDVADALAAVTEGDHVVIPFHANIVRADR